MPFLYLSLMLLTVGNSDKVAWEWRGSCYDGDTCTVLLDLGYGIWRETSIRLCDVDTPEIGDSSKAIIAKDFTNRMMSAGKVSISIYRRKNGAPVYSFNRVMAHVYIDGVDLGTMLVNKGLAVMAEKRCTH